MKYSIKEIRDIPVRFISMVQVRFKRILFTRLKIINVVVYKNPDRRISSWNDFNARVCAS